MTVIKALFLGTDGCCAFRSLVVCTLALLFAAAAAADDDDYICWIYNVLIVSCGIHPMLDDDGELFLSLRQNFYEKALL